jgi:signal transduction histidine kinase/CheY-like chemotaxis protein
MTNFDSSKVSDVQAKESAVASQVEEMQSQHLKVLLLCGLMPLTIALMRAAGWIGSPHPLYAWPVLAALGIGMSAAYFLQVRRPALAPPAFIGALSAANLLEAVLFPSGPALYLFGIIGVIATLLASQRAAAGWIMLIVAMQCAVMWWLPPYTTGDWARPLIVMLGTSGAAWLGMHRVQTVLKWYLQTTRDAISAAQDAQTHRAELMRLNKELDSAYLRLERLNNMLIMARKEAEDARLLKVQFANAVSHELRSPINLIIGFSDMMMNAPEVYEDQQWSPRLRNHVAQIYQSSQHLSQLIDDVLDMSRIDAYRMSLVKERTPIATVIAEAYEMVRSLFEVRSLYLRVEIEPDLPPIMLDHIRVRQVLLNLLTNAVRFTTEGGVTIRACRSAGEPIGGVFASSVVISVCDTGIGIAEADLPRLFQVFCQLDNAYRWNRGSGLGLSISKQLVELHGGRIWASSEVGKGTTFSFSLPLDVEYGMPMAALSDMESQEASFWSRLETKAHGHKSVLAITDQPHAQRLITGRSERDPALEVTWLHEHVEMREVQQVVERVRPVAILVVSGDMESTARMKQRVDVVEGIPIVALTLPGLGRPSLPDVLNDYLIKPVSRHKLSDALQRLQRTRRDIRCVLVVEDEPSMREFLVLALRLIFGPAVVVHDRDTGSTALTCVVEQRPDLVLVDLNLPDGDGLELAAAIRAECAEAAIIAVTARDLHLKDFDVAPDVITCTRTHCFSQRELESMLAALAAGFSAGRALQGEEPVREEFARD